MIFTFRNLECEERHTEAGIGTHDSLRVEIPKEEPETPVEVLRDGSHLPFLSHGFSTLWILQKQKIKRENNLSNVFLIHLFAFL